MKYIRTKDGVYEIERYYEPRDYYWVKQDCEQPIGSDEIIKQADTIEELCDEFVEVYGDHKELVDLSRVVYYTKITLGEYYLNRIANRKALGSLIDDKDKDIKLYGAIWTDKGLIYVAKMNEEGVLCLI